MSKKISVYELLGLIKDGKAPKRIIYQGNYLEFDGEDYKYYKEAETLSEDSLVKYIAVGNLNDTVEILEEDKPKIYPIFLNEECGMEMIEAICDKLNEIIDYLNRKEDK